jgi:hypothetical protein
MSKLESRIEKISRGSPAPMGFGAASRAAQTPAMALIGILPNNALEGAKSLAGLDADGALLAGVDSGEEISSLTEALGSTPWGVKADALNGESVDDLVQKGCDFFLVSPDNVTVEAAKDDRAAFILSLPMGANDAFLRALEDLPICAAFTSLTADGPLTLQRLIDVASVRTMFDKYLLVEVPARLSSKELEGLRDVGVDAVVVNMEASTEESLKAMKKRLVELPRQRKPRSERSSAIIPAGLGAGSAHSDHEEEEYDDASIEDYRRIN